jgi:hypothetical protein
MSRFHFDDGVRGAAAAGTPWRRSGSQTQSRDGIPDTRAYSKISPDAVAGGNEDRFSDPQTRTVHIWRSEWSST